MKKISIYIASTMIVIASVPSLARAAGEIISPAWIRQENSPLKSIGTSSPLDPFLVKIPPDSRLSKHQTWSEAKLNDLAIFHTNLSAKIDRMFPLLEKTYATLLTRIEVMEGDTTLPNAQMAAAREKIDIAKQKIEDLRSYVPPVLSEENVASTTKVKLKEPRKLGKDAIEAIKSAKKALNEVILTLAEMSEFEVDKDGKIVPKPNI